MGHRIAFPGLSINMTERLVVVKRSDRKDTPHLTISFENLSGEIDLHLKYESAKNDASSTYEPIIKIQKVVLEQELEHFFLNTQAKVIQLCLRNVKKVRPGWLARHGYILMWVDEEELKKDLFNTAPKKRGKHRFDPSKLKLLFTDNDLSRIRIFYPDELHGLAAMGFNGTLNAVRANKKPRMIQIKGIQVRNRIVWVMFHRKTVPEFSRVLNELIPQRFKDEVKLVWFKIYDALQLNEIGIERE
ncbi:MAG: hypothetical protein H0T60_06395 [Acidobacteria bacterium]|nr:hypothetical protein [Acidobacteriota bacterium]